MAKQNKRKPRSDSVVAVTQENKGFYCSYFWKALHGTRIPFQGKLKRGASLVVATNTFVEWGLTFDGDIPRQRLEDWIDAFVNKAGRASAKNAYRQHCHRKRQQSGSWPHKRKYTVEVSGVDHAELRRIATNQGISIEQVLALIMEEVRNPTF